MIILIDGQGGSGKAVLRGLLDGHPDLFVFPIHDMIPDALCDFSDPRWLTYKDILHLRSLLSGSYYHQIEWFARKREMEIEMSATERNYYPIDLDFRQFDETWMSRLVKESQWTPQLIVEHIYQALFESWRNYPVSKAGLPNHYVGMGYSKPNTIDLFPVHYPDGKLLYVTRSVEGIIATRGNRRPVADDMRSEHLVYRTAQTIISGGIVREIVQRQERACVTAQARPNQVKIVEFYDLIHRTEATMRDVAEFLGIPYVESMTVCSVLGEEMVSDSGKKWVGKELDDPTENLSGYEQALISLEKDGVNFFRIHNWRHPFAILYASRLRMSRLLKSFRQRLAKFIGGKGFRFGANQWTRDY